MEGTIGEIRLFAPNFSPRTWAYCAGQLLAISTNQALFAILGTTYGGDGRTTFALPNFQGRYAVGVGQSPMTSYYRLGQVGGVDSVTLTTQNLPNHTHAPMGKPSVTINMNCFNGAATTGEPENQFPATATTGVYNAIADDVMANIEVTAQSSISLYTAGGSQPFPIQPPVIGINYIICLTGIFPSRD